MNTSTTATQKIFVVGVGRSGTSLLQAILGSHSDIGFLPETGFIRRYLFQGTLGTALQENGTEGVRTILNQDTRLNRLSFDVTDVLNSIPTDVGFDEKESLDLAIYNKLHEFESGRYSGDKDPRLIEHIEQLLTLWPDAKIIHLFRDPRDVVASKKKAEWSSSKSLFSQLVATCAQFKLGIASSKAVSGDSLYRLQYEMLITTPEEELTKLCEWLAIDFEQPMLNFKSSAEKLVAEDEKQWKAEVLGPLLSSNFNKWKENLTDLEIFLTEYSCSKTMANGHYQPYAAGLSMHKVLGYIGGNVIKATAIIYCQLRTIKNRKLISNLTSK